MGPAFTGGCACGSLRYAMSGQPAAQFQCQCRDCQRLGGGGHSSWLIFGDPAEVCVTGPAARWSSYSAGGVEKRHGFCPTCGSPVFLTFPANPGHTAVLAGSLDDPSRFQPGFVTWGSTGPAWDRLDPTLTVFDKMPPAR
jgi:hypothetical protein